MQYSFYKTDIIPILQMFTNCAQGKYISDLETNIIFKSSCFSQYIHEQILLSFFSAISSVLLSAIGFAWPSTKVFHHPSGHISLPYVKRLNVSKWETQFFFYFLIRIM